MYADMVGRLSMQSGALEAAHAALTGDLPTEPQEFTLFIRDFGKVGQHAGAKALGGKRSQRVPCTLHLQRNADSAELYGCTSVRVKDAVRTNLHRTVGAFPQLRPLGTWTTWCPLMCVGHALHCRLAHLLGG